MIEIRISPSPSPCANYLSKKKKKEIHVSVDGLVPHNHTATQFISSWVLIRYTLPTLSSSEQPVTFESIKNAPSKYLIFFLMKYTYSLWLNILFIEMTYLYF